MDIDSLMIGFSICNELAGVKVLGSTGVWIP